NASFRLHGRLDDVRTYNKLITASDVANIISSAGNSVPAISSLTSSSSSVLTNVNVTFTLNATDANQDALYYSFDFGDGGGQGPYTLSKTATHSYPGPGRYTVVGRVRDALGTVSATMLQIV